MFYFIFYFLGTFFASQSLTILEVSVYIQYSWKKKLIMHPLQNFFFLIRLVVGVTQLVNKKGGKPHPLNECVNEYDYTGRFFTSYDEELAKSFSVYCGISLHHVSHVTDRVTCGHV